MSYGIVASVLLSQKVVIYLTPTNGEVSCSWMSAQKFPFVMNIQFNSINHYATTRAYCV